VVDASDDGALKRAESILGAASAAPDVHLFIALLHGGALQPLLDVADSSLRAGHEPQVCACTAFIGLSVHGAQHLVA
jgi:hypothetical protein